MYFYIANADGTDDSLANIVLAVESLFALGAVFALGAIPIVLAKRRDRMAGRKPTSNLAAVLVLWGMLAAGTGIYSLVVEAHWSRTYNAALLSGDYDPQGTDISNGKPKPLWFMWGALAAGYIALIGWAIITPAPGR